MLTLQAYGKQSHSALYITSHKLEGDLIAFYMFFETAIGLPLRQVFPTDFHAPLLTYVSMVFYSTIRQRFDAVS